MGRKKAVISVLAALFVLAGFVYLRYTAENKYAVARSVVARADLPAFTVLREELVELKQLPREEVQPDAYGARDIAELKLLNGLITVVDIPKGGQVRQSAFLNKNDERARAGAYREPAKRFYLAGLKYFHEGDLSKAYMEWKTARIMDPSSPDAAAAIGRLERSMPSTLKDVTDREALPDYAAGGAAPYRLLAVISARDLPAYTVLKEGMLKAGLLPAADLRPDTFVVRDERDIGVIYNFITVKDIPEGAPVTGAAMLGRAALKADPAAYREPARRRYLEGQEFFNQGDYGAALEKWWVAKTLDPSSAEAAAAYKRAEKMAAGKRGK
ncbi:MAG: hypothetical protein A3J79_06585 [Elusimicrobia bacterium RIFOXYB2_FULL_62_6]|nr:MAG: hypothetical protein A3J79_06585 [Elusimicrobia bacterium RIFOXYB2_FULL_62_6]